MKDARLAYLDNSNRKLSLNISLICFQIFWNSHSNGHLLERQREISRECNSISCGSTRKLV